MQRASIHSHEAMRLEKLRAAAFVSKMSLQLELLPRMGPMLGTLDLKSTEWISNAALGSMIFNDFQCASLFWDVS